MDFAKAKERIKELREKKKLTQEKLAEVVGIGQRNLSKIECGKNFVTSETLAKIISALKIKPADLFNFEHNKDTRELKEELLEAIQNETVDINLMYKFYQSIK